MAMIGWIGLVVGLVMLATGALLLLGLLRLLAEGRAAAFVAIGLACGLMLLIGIVGLVVLSAPSATYHYEYSPSIEGGRWVTEDGEPIEEPRIVGTFGPPMPVRPAIAPPMSAAPKVVTLPVSHVQAEVTKIEPTDPTATSSAFSSTDSAPEVAGPRPEWIDRKPEWIEGEYRVPLASGLFPTPLDAKNDLTARARRELSDYYAKEYQIEDGGQLSPEGGLDHLINSQVLREPYNEPVKSDILETTMYRSHGLLVITPELRSKLESIWRKQLVDRRLGTTGQSAGGVLALLLAVWGVLKMTGRREMKPVAA